MVRRELRTELKEAVSLYEQSEEEPSAETEQSDRKSAEVVASSELREVVLKGRLS